MHKNLGQTRKEKTSIQELTVLLDHQIANFQLECDGEDFLSYLGDVARTLELLDEQKDPAIYAMMGGYVREFVTSFLILYNGTQDLEKSLEALSQIKALTTYIVLLDKHYDEKSYHYKVLADRVFRELMKNTQGYVKNSIELYMAQLWATASYEIKLKGRMLKDEVFEKKEIRNHILQKSSDTVLYSVIFDKYVDSFNPNVVQLIHYNQALLDIQDDFNDIDEDILHRDLNIFIMCMRGEIPISDIFSGQVEKQKIIKKSADIINFIIDDLEKCIDGTGVPPKFAFLKSLSKLYIKDLKNSIAGKKKEEPIFSY